MIIYDYWIPLAKQSYKKYILFVFRMHRNPKYNIFDSNNNKPAFTNMR